VRTLALLLVMARFSLEAWAGPALEARPASDDPASQPADYQPSGDYYDWRQTMQPERPWFLQYDQTLVMKIFLAERTDQDRNCRVYLTFEQALDVIRRLDHLTCGAPKIVYLVGWQYNGHDSKYPAWGEVNPRLKRADDASALDSLKWLMRQGRKYHTTVSLHINAFDAYEDSPLWAEYLAKDIIAKGRQGAPLKGEMMGDMQSYQLSYAKEWETGCAKRRIDGLLKMLPELKQAHTIHVDAFHTYPPVPHAYPAGRYPDRDLQFKGISPWLGYSAERESAAQRKTFRYFRDCGLDVTSEGSTFLRPDAFVGLQPMAWDYQPPASGIPPRLYCGTAMRAEPEIKADPVKLTGLLDQFCLKAAPQIWANAWRRHHGDSPPSAQDSARILRGNDCCVPLTWKPGLRLLAYSRGGCQLQTWHLDPAWQKVKKARLDRVTPEGHAPTGTIAINSGELRLSLAAGQAVLITAK